VIDLYGYLGIGASVPAIVFGMHRLSVRRELEPLREVLDAFYPERERASYRTLNHFVVPALAAVAVVTAWPVAV
jgi:hypothetical protein